MPNTWSDEAPQQRESRLAMSACMNADVAFRGVRDGLCYFEVYLTDDLDGPGVVLSLPADGLTAEKIAQSCRRGGMEQAEGKMKSGAVETTAPLIAEPELGELRCPNGHDSSIPPRHPALIFVACHHYGIDATWNEFCITCGARHEPYMIYRDFHRMDGKAVGPNYCGYCGAKMVSGRASR